MPSASVILLRGQDKKAIAKNEVVIMGGYAYGTPENFLQFLNCSCCQLYAYLFITGTVSKHRGFSELIRSVGLLGREYQPILLSS